MEFGLKLLFVQKVDLPSRPNLVQNGLNAELTQKVLVSWMNMQNSFFLFSTGSKEECEKAQVLLEKGNTSDKKQWSSAETELSDNESSDGSIISDDVRYFT